AVVEIVQVERIDEVFEDAQALVRCVGVSWLALDFLFRRAGRALHDRLLDVDRDVHTHGQGNRVAGPRIDFKPPSVQLDHDSGVKHVVAQIVDHNLHDFCAHFRYYRFQQIVSERARNLDLLQLDGDRVSFTWPNPDWQITVTRHIFQDHNPVLGHQTHTDTVNCNFNHNPLALTTLWPAGWLSLYVAAFQQYSRFCECKPT